MDKKQKLMTIVTLLIIGVAFTIFSGTVINANKKVDKPENYVEVTATKLNIAETKKLVTQDFKDEQKKAKKVGNKYFNYNGESYKTDRSYAELPEYKVTYEFNYNDRDFTTIEIYSDANDIKDTLTVYVNKNDTTDILTSSPAKTKSGLKMIGYIMRFFGAVALILSIALIVNTLKNRVKASKANKVNLDKQEDTQEDKVDLLKN